MGTNNTRAASVFVVVAVLCFYAGSCNAARQLFSDGFDTLSNWTVVGQDDTSVTIVDYGALGVPEAPNKAAGSRETTGVKFVANTSLGQPAAVNLIGAITGGNADLSLSRFSVSFDMYLSVSDPLPSGSTEHGIWGLGRTTDDVVGRSTSLTSGNGVFGWLATENGYRAEDAVAFVDTSEFGRLNGHDSFPLFNSTFSSTVSVDRANSPANQWVEVTLTADNNLVEVLFNSRRFFSIPVASAAGDVMVGYEDAFSSISSRPDQQFGLIDNVVVAALPPAFSGYYAPENWFVATDGRGGVDSTRAPSRLSLQGHDDGFIEYSIKVPFDGDFSFSWSFFNFDFDNFDDAGFVASYFVNDEQISLSEEIFATGEVSVSVVEGDVIGWRLAGSEVGSFGSSLTITEFSAPLPIPEPTTLVFLMTLVLTATAWKSRGPGGGPCFLSFPYACRGNAR